MCERPPSACTSGAEARYGLHETSSGWLREGRDGLLAVPFGAADVIEVAGTKYPTNRAMICDWRKGDCAPDATIVLRQLSLEARFVLALAQVDAIPPFKKGVSRTTLASGCIPAKWVVHLEAPDAARAAHGSEPAG